ncbi:MAG: helix-turn-helix domain-containing protein [Myxococcales bacterium]|nr:helix-turn-helix domain-containing protein [Myxococcales bacterium]
MEMLNYADAARMIGVPVGTLYSWVGRQQIPHVRLGPRLVRFRRAEIDAWLAQKHVPPIEVPASSTSRPSP